MCIECVSWLLSFHGLFSEFSNSSMMSNVGHNNHIIIDWSQYLKVSKHGLRGNYDERQRQYQEMMKERQLMIQRQWLMQRQLMMETVNEEDMIEGLGFIQLPRHHCVYFEINAFN